MCKMFNLRLRKRITIVIIMTNVCLRCFLRYDKRRKTSIENAVAAESKWG